MKRGRARASSIFVSTLVASASLSSACGAPHEPAPAHAAAAPSASTTSQAPAEIACIEPEAKSPLDRDRSRAVDLLVDGQSRRAVHAFARVLDRRPNDVSAFVLREAALRDLKGRIVDEERSFAALEARAVTEPIRGYVFHRKGWSGEATELPTLRIASVGPRPQDSVSYDVDAALPGDADARTLLLGSTATLNALLPHDDHRVFVTTSQAAVVVSDGKNPPLAFDLGASVGNGPSDASRRPIVAAQAVGGMLLVGLGPLPSQDPQPAESGYLAAIDLESGTLDWVSEPFVSNAGSFVVTGSHVITGFGHRGGKGGLHVLDLATGKEVAHFPLPHPPSRLATDDDSLLVYSDEETNGTTTIAVAPTLLPAPPAEMPKGRATPLPTGPKGFACVLRRAMSALDRRDAKAAEQELAALGEGRGRYGESLAAAAAFIARADENDPGVIDLSKPAPAIAKPSFEDPSGAPTVANPIDDPKHRALRIVQKSSRHYDKAVYGEGGVDVDVLPAAGGSPPLMPAAAPIVTFEVPPAYGVTSLSGSVVQDGVNILLYGRRFVAVLDGRTTRGVLDLGKPLATSPLSDSVFIPIVQIAGDTLFVSAVSEAASTDHGGQRDLVAAYDWKTGARRWRSAPLVSSVGIAVAHGYVFTARGFGQEKAFLYVLASDTGEVVRRLPLRSAPRSINLAPDDRGRPDRSLVVPCAQELVTYDLSL